MWKPDDVSRHAPQRSSPRNSTKLVHTDDGATSPETRPPPALTADAVSRRVLGLWERALDAIDAGNLDAIAREIEWVIKYQLIQRYRAEHDVPLSAPEVTRASLAYHDIHRDRGLYYELQRSAAVERTARDIDIFEAKTVPAAPSRYRKRADPVPAWPPHPDLTARLHVPGPPTPAGHATCGRTAVY
jgi:hypothetical protein